MTILPILPTHYTREDLEEAVRVYERTYGISTAELRHLHRSGEEHDVPGFVRGVWLSFDREVQEIRAWENQKEPCSGSGYAHKAHGACPGYRTDRT